MSDIKNNSESMEDLMNELEDSLKRINVGDVVNGKVISVTEEEIMMDIQFRSDGIVTREEVSEEGSLLENFKAGDIINVQILKIDDGSGNVVLSKKRADSLVAWDEIEKAYNEKNVISSKVNEIVKGGLVSDIDGIRAFIPASHMELFYVDDFGSYVGKEFKFNIIEFEKEKNKVVLSRKDILTKVKNQEKSELLDSIKVGNIYTGKVTKLANYGAFVDIGGIDGLVHVSEMSWRRVKHPSEILSENDDVEVKVLKFDRANEKISLKLTNVEENPWSKVDEIYEENDIVEVEITRLADFGAFAKLETGIEGLIHVSKISEERINKPSDKLSVGDKVEALILEIDKKNQKMSLSIKDVEEEIEIEEEIHEESAETESSVMEDLFGDKLKNLFK